MGLATLTTAVVVTIFFSFINPVYHLGCYQGWLNNTRTLQSLTFAADNMTVDLCASFCRRNRYFGLEYARECYCGDVQIAPPTSSPSECSMPCAGDASQRCGGPNRQDLYINLVYSPRKPASLLPAATYLGCFVDDGNPRVLPDGNMLGAEDMTAEKCRDHCKGYAYFGVEFGFECWCGKTRPGIVPVGGEAECGFPCRGDDEQVCGGPNRVNVWERVGSVM